MHKQPPIEGVLDLAEWDDGKDPDYEAEDIVAWTYMAAVHCVTCANRTFGGRALDTETARDLDGSRVYPVFITDEWPEERGSCATCRTVFVGRRV